MTIEELFPKGKYQFRASTAYSLPDFHLMVEITHFFHKPPYYPQFVGEFKTFRDDSGELSVKVVSIRSPRGEEAYYMENSEEGFDHWEPEEADAVLKEFMQNLSEKYEDINFDLGNLIKASMLAEHASSWKRID
ncbi:MAG: hypothetical protein A3H69_00615 [Candidatus Sungbacteria bacterium RIFCSPLOWO2_02_FULL_47_9]|uniref:Uncharacterized protein n=1 Tax=Candidatus Sungbacteria bacterium RIFCSPHIGHO2_01_FULL_47_32 TaxID=1802264 RepID=A0A1G2K1Z0_9BACT|nr:MAG: hypothetical protein UX72_C0025G0002 [Parcubacteria group bacterium GW2011_GWA2_47_10]OGZ93444.1 MAG: hypothetical protein A2633_01830 [Candidatus Sungbacteria bacterium RIFCSPHIGHO2_01_FULL_47_32]OGZ99806.1 MAG: hypothetical protein A3D57_01085 [Candidatus Sungbacteria bacterium RIFCSPHIGHO2_02_FULL_46_12]OHA05021.1 MAG: hypothetical protein A3A28_03750 [Candidatus Sungbacteria bacterium RIFCSPLOWO2_01_FULL_47_32]OHA11864.1 MAG: hypothetical protein A3H69_00615 [Candidatus Sungbacteria